MIPDPSGQLAELIVYITSTRVDLYSHQILLVQNGLYGKFSLHIYSDQIYKYVFSAFEIWGSQAFAIHDLL